MRSFAQMIVNVRASENAVYDAILETAAYIHQQYHAGRVKDGAGMEYMPQFIGAIRTKWIADKVSKLGLQSGRKLGALDFDTVCMMVAPKVSDVFHAQKAKNAQARVKRAASPAKVEDTHTHSKTVTDAIEGECVTITEVSDALVIGGTAYDLSAEEATMLETMLIQMRIRNAPLAIAA